MYLELTIDIAFQKILFEQYDILMFHILRFIIFNFRIIFFLIVSTIKLLHIEKYPSTDMWRRVL